MNSTVVLLHAIRLFTKYGAQSLQPGDLIQGLLLDRETLSCRIVDKQRDLIVHEWQSTKAGWRKLWRETSPLEELGKAAE